jgi:site-specific DNA recombinase
MAMRDKLMRRDLFEDVCDEYVRELNRLRMEHRAKVSGARHELAAVEREIRKLIQAIKDGVPGSSIKDEMLSLENRGPTCRRASPPLRCRSFCTPEWRTCLANA